MRAALIGRLVLPTIHTSTPEAAVERLTELGVAPYLLDDTLRGSWGRNL